MSDFIMIKNARASFPHLFSKPTINGEEGKCGAILMLDPQEHSNDIKVIEKQIATFFKEKFKGRKLPDEKLCLREGEDKGRAEYEGFKVLSANSKGFPIVISNNGQDVITCEDDSSIYAGCYVNAKVRLWAQDNNFGKRVNAELVAIQFAGDGEPLDGSYVSVDDAMEGFNTEASNDDYDFLEGAA